MRGKPLPRAKRLKAGLLLAVMAALWGCAAGSFSGGPGDVRLAERSANRRPGWITQLPREEGYFFATGIATGAASLEEGKRAGVQAAVQEVVDYLGVRAKVRYSETRTELTTRLINRIDSEGFARVMKGTPVDMYFERLLVPGAGRSVYRFDVYVLLKIPQGVLDDEEARLKADRQRRLDLAARLLREGQVYLEAGDAGGTLRRWIESGRLLDGEWGVEALLQEIQTAISDLVGAVVLITDPERGKPAAREGPWTVRAVLRRGRGAIPLRWLPLTVRFQTAGGVLTEGVATDEKGEVRVEARPGAQDSSQAGVSVGVDMERLLALGGGKDRPPENLLARLGALAAITLWLNRPARTFQAEALRQDPGAGSPAGEDTRELSPAGGSGGVDSLTIRIETSNARVYAGRAPSKPEVGYLIDLRAASAIVPRRRALNLALVVDRSGSMAEAGKMEYVKEAVRLVSRSLAVQDRLSLVSYSDEAKVVLSGGTARDRLYIEHHLAMLEPMGVTNLSGGLFEGVHQAETYREQRGLNRVILFSDGLANRGMVDRRELARYAAKVSQKGISISTVGVGKEFDENLLMELASAGQGRYYYAGSPEALPGMLLAEMQELATLVAQNITLTLSLDRGVEFADAFGFSHEKGAGEVRLKLGDISSGGRILVGLVLRLPDRAEGMREIGSIALSYDQVSGESGRVQRRFPLEYTRDRARAEGGLNPRVARYLQVLATMDAMVLAVKSADKAAAQESLRYLESELQSLRAWVRMVDDPDVASLTRVFEDCLVEFRQGMAQPAQGAASSNRDAVKEIRYKLYRFQRQTER